MILRRARVALCARRGGAGQESGRTSEVADTGQRLRQRIAALRFSADAHGHAGVDPRGGVAPGQAL